MSDLAKNVVPYSPSRRVRAVIGDIVMTGAEIDHLISLALFKMLKIDFSIGFVLFDRATMGTKLAKLKYFVEVSNDETLVKKFDNLCKALQPLMKMRNTVAHGHIVGKTKFGNEILFLVTADYTDHLGEFVSTAISFTEEQLTLISNNSKACVEEIKRVFDVKPLHETTSYKLLPDPPKSLKAQRKNNRSKH